MSERESKGQRTERTQLRYQIKTGVVLKADGTHTAALSNRSKGYYIRLPAISDPALSLRPHNRALFWCRKNVCTAGSYTRRRIVDRHLKSMWAVHMCAFVNICVGVCVWVSVCLYLCLCLCVCVRLSPSLFKNWCVWRARIFLLFHSRSCDFRLHYCCCFLSASFCVKVCFWCEKSLCAGFFVSACTAFCLPRLCSLSPSS